MSLVSEFLQKVGLIRNETQYHGNTKERVADTFETLFNLDVWFKKVDSSDPKAGKLITWDGQAVEGGGLATDMNNLDDDILEADKKVIREKLGAAYEGFDNDNSGELSGSVGGETNTNSGAGSANVGGGGNINSGATSASVGGVLLENKAYAETSRGLFNLSESNHADSATSWHDDDLIESVGGGDEVNNRLNLFARYKSGAFYWIKKTLSTITNAVKGFHAADTDGRLNYFDGSVWKKYLLEGEGSGGAYIEILNQFNDVNGDIDLDLITEEGTYVLKVPRDQGDLNGLPYYGGDGPGNVQIDVFITDNYTMQRVIYYTYTDGRPILAYRFKYGSNPYLNWDHSYKEDYNGVAPSVTASVATSYNIYVKEKAQHYDLTMTDDTDISFLEMIEANETKVITITLKGDYAFTFPAWLKSLETNDEYDTIGGTLAAEIVINIKNGGASPQGYYTLQMIDYVL